MSTASRSSLRRQAAHFVRATAGLTRSNRCSSGWHPGSGESTEAWADFLTDLRDRGLSCPCWRSRMVRTVDRRGRASLPAAPAPKVLDPLPFSVDVDGRERKDRRFSSIFW